MPPRSLISLSGPLKSLALNSVMHRLTLPPLVWCLFFLEFLQILALVSSFVKREGWSWGGQHPTGPALRLLTRSDQNGVAESAAIAQGCVCVPVHRTSWRTQLEEWVWPAQQPTVGPKSSPFVFVEGCARLRCGARVEPGARPSTEELGAPRPRPTEGAKAVTASKRAHIAGWVCGRSVPRLLVGSLLPAGVCGAPRPFLPARPPPPHAPLQPRARPHPLSGIRRPSRGEGGLRRAARSRHGGGLWGAAKTPGAAGWGLPRDPVPQPYPYTAFHSLRNHHTSCSTVRARPTAGAYARSFARGLNFRQSSVYRLVN